MHHLANGAPEEKQRNDLSFLVKSQPQLAPRVLPLFSGVLQPSSQAPLKVLTTFPSAGSSSTHPFSRPKDGELPTLPLPAAQGLKS